MKAFLLAVLGALVIAGLSAWALSLAQRDAAVAYSRESVRLGEASHRLIVEQEALLGGEKAGAPPRD